MPPKKKTTMKGPGKGKTKGRGGCVLEVAADDASSDDTMASLQTIPPDEADAKEGAEGGEENIEDPKAKRRRKVETVALNSEDEEMVIEWYREHPIFHDQSKREFKNKVMKDHIMGEKAKELKFTSKYFFKHLKKCFY